MLKIIPFSKPSLLCYKIPTHISLNGIFSTIAKLGGLKRFYLISYNCRIIFQEN